MINLQVNNKAAVSALGNRLEKKASTGRTSWYIISLISADRLLIKSAGNVTLAFDPIALILEIRTTCCMPWSAI